MTDLLRPDSEAALLGLMIRKPSHGESCTVQINHTLQSLCVVLSRTRYRVITFEQLLSVPMERTQTKKIMTPARNVRGRFAAVCSIHFVSNQFTANNIIQELSKL